MGKKILYLLLLKKRKFQFEVGFTFCIVELTFNEASLY